MRRLLLLFFCVLALSGCLNGRLLYSFEEPFWASWGGGLRTELGLLREGLRAGYLPRFRLVPPGQNAGDALARALTARRYGTVVVGPFLSFEWRSYASRFPGTRFVLVGESPSAELPPNVTALHYGHAEALRNAGAAAAMSVRDEQGGAPQSAWAHLLAILTGPGPELSSKEVDAFSAGVAEVLGGEPVVQTIDNPADKNLVKSAIESLRKEGVEIFLLGLGATDPWCLEVLRTAGGCAVVQGWVSSALFPSQVFLSVEEDIPAGISLALAASARQAREVSGPVRLVAGSARAIPEAARAWVAGE